MRGTIIAGALIGVAMGAGGIVGVDAVTESAQAESAGGPTLAQVKAADLRSQRAIKQGVFAWNLVAKYLAAPGQRISAKAPTNVRQDAGVGGGLPRETIADGAVDASKIAAGGVGPAELADGAVTRAKLSGPVERSLPRWIVKVNNDMGVPVTRGTPGVTMSRLATGTYVADFGTDVSQCSWTATPTVDSGVPAAQTARTMPAPGGDPSEVLAETFNGAGFLVESGVTVQATC